MKKLKKAYEAIEMLNKLGLPVSKEQKDALAKMENSYLKREVIPFIEQEVQKKVEGFYNEFYIYVSYSKDNAVKVSLIDNTNNSSKNRRSAKAKSTKTRKFTIRVIFPNGRAICHKQVLNTLIEVVEFAGPENVINLKIPSVTGNLVSPELVDHPTYSRSQKRLSTGHYIQTNSGTDRKFAQINTINKKLKLGLKVEKVLIDKPDQ